MSTTTLVTITHVETCPKCQQRWAVRRVEPDRVHLMCRHCMYHWARKRYSDDLAPQTDTAILHSRQSERMKRPCWPVRMAGHLVDGLRAFLVAFGERLDGTSVDEVKRHGG